VAARAVVVREEAAMGEAERVAAAMAEVRAAAG
jgi:hypothetical protein